MLHARCGPGMTAASSNIVSLANVSVQSLDALHITVVIFALSAFHMVFAHLSLLLLCCLDSITV